MNHLYAFRTVALVALLFPGSALAQSRWAKHYRDRVAAFERENAQLDPAKRYVVLLGSSSMEGWKHGKRLERYLNGVPALNRGISADTIGRGARGILNRLEASVYQARPSHVFLLNGRNDLGRSKRPPVRATARTYEEVVKRIQKKLPNTVVCIVTCAPVNLKYKVMHPHLLRLNTALKAIAKRRKCPVIDLHTLLKGPDGLLPRAITRDGLHFKDKGYEVLGREIKKVIARHPAKSPRKKTKKTPTTKPIKKTAAETIEETLAR